MRQISDVLQNRTSSFFATNNGAGLHLGADDGRIAAIPIRGELKGFGATGIFTGATVAPSNLRTSRVIRKSAAAAAAAGVVEDTSNTVTEMTVDGSDEFHVIFSTDCSAYQHWQSIVCFYSAARVGQRGTITRIASGCTAQEEADVRDLHSRLPRQFRVHFTPDFKEDKKTGKRYASPLSSHVYALGGGSLNGAHFSCRVRGSVGDGRQCQPILTKGLLWLWRRWWGRLLRLIRYDFFNKPFGLLHWLEHADGIGQDAVVALIDPDFIFLRPLDATVGAAGETVVSKPVRGRSR
jgi:hypothetical protein